MRIQAQASAPIRLRNIPRSQTQHAYFLNDRVAAHGQKGNLNLSCEALSQSFFRRVLQICTLPQLPEAQLNPCFSERFMILRLLRENSSQPSRVRFPTSRSDDRLIPGDAMDASNRSKPAPAVPDFAPHGIRPARWGKNAERKARHQNSASMSRGVGHGEKQTGRGICESIRGW